MNKTGKRVPITDAKNIGDKNGYSQVIIACWDSKTGITSICTWGKTLDDCDQAAAGGNLIKKTLGWPDEMCKDVPTRIKNKIKSNDTTTTQAK